MNVPRNILATTLTALLVLIGLAPLAHPNDPPAVLNASEMEARVHDGDVTVGVFTVTANGERTVEVDANSKTGANGMAFSQRLKLGGSGTAEYRSVRFTTLGEATLNVYAL